MCSGDESISALLLADVSAQPFHVCTYVTPFQRYTEDNEGANVCVVRSPLYAHPLAQILLVIQDE